MSAVTRKIFLGLAPEEECSAIHQVPGGSEVREKGRRLEGEREDKGRGERMTRSTEGEEALSRNGVLGLELFAKKTGSMLPFSWVGIKQVMGGQREKRGGESDSLNVTFREIKRRLKSVSHNL